jgi:hypothetical protein
MNLFKYFTIGFEIISEIMSASKDGWITSDEIIQIVTHAVSSLGIKIKV